MTSIAPKFKRYVNYHLRKEMMRERERMIFSNEFQGLLLLHFYRQSRNKPDENFSLKNIKTVLYIKSIYYFSL